MMSSEWEKILPENSPQINAEPFPREPAEDISENLREK
jgi:hypothetical protein